MTAAPAPELCLLHVDEALIVANKPSGLLSVPGRGPDKQDCLIHRLQARFPEALTVHRLDLATSGLIVCGRGPDMQRALSQSFEQRRVHKRYTAVVSGLLAAPQEDWGLIDLPLITDWPNRPLQKIDHDLGKPSQTRYRVLAHDLAQHSTRVALEPLTGRTHQLRVHLLALGHPILGDALYAPGQDLPPPGLDRLHLHASELGFEHPVTGAKLHFENPAPF